MPTPEQRRPVLSIDLGASFTKVAWRPEWKEDEKRFREPSRVVKIDGSELTPTLAYDPGDGEDWLFGRQAATVTPGVAGRLHQNWKSVLFDEHASPAEESAALEVAQRFFAWLRKKLSQKNCRASKAHTRICVPALRNSKIGRDRLLSAMEAAGWSDSESVTGVTEPKANVIGLASGGRNHLNIFDGVPEVWLPETYGNNSPLMRAARGTAEGAAPRRLCTIDIGTFTTDISLSRVGDGIAVEKHVSFKHGISQLDRQLEKLVSSRGGDLRQVSHEEFEQLKRQVYGTEAYVLLQDRVSIELEADCVLAGMIEFADTLLEHATPYRDANWFILTGGGSKICTIADRVREGLGGLYPVQHAFPDTTEDRIATALGGASVIIDFYEPGLATPPTVHVGDTRSDCPCGGGNKDCFRCGGTGIWKRRSTPPPSRLGQPNGKKPPPLPPVATKESLPVTGDPKPIPVAPPPPQSPTVPTGERTLPIVRPTAPNPRPLPDPTVPLVPEADLIECWKGNEQAAIAEFCFEGWMGQLVFDGAATAEERRQVLMARDDSAGKAAWCKLLCLCTSLGVRTHPTVVKRFWDTELSEIWGALIPHGTKVSDPAVLDRFFEDKIHRHFTNQWASGEDAELWRRVFYDFRKLHFFVYHDGLPAALLELLEQRGLSFNALVHFLKSGRVPGQTRWAGVLGQSMTAPLLLLMRFVRRLKVIGSTDFDAACFYMNGPARRVATRLGWIDEAERTWYDIDSLVELSKKCHARMTQAAPELAGYFDIPLQWYAHRHRPELRLL